MAFAVMTVIAANRDEIPEVLADITLLGVDAVASQLGFRQARVYRAEDGSEVMTITEWDSRDHFLAFRQSEAGRLLVREGIRRHPRISFYETVSELSPEPPPVPGAL